MKNSYDVAIVGYGPTGMSAAALLGQAGHRVIVVERWPSLYGLPRLTHIDDDTARTLQEICDIDRALADSSPTVYEWVNGEDDVLLSMATPMGNQGYPVHNSIYQPDIEAAIDVRLRSLPNVTLRQGWILTGLAQETSDVRITVAPFVDRHADESRTEAVAAKYVIGCDGNRSSVRAALGVPVTEYDFHETWVTFDAEWLRPMPEKFALAKQYCDPARGHMYMGIGRTRQRFEFAVLPGEDPEKFADISTCWAWLEQTHGLTPQDLRPLRYLRYAFTGRVADQWRSDRVFIAGDAAHTMPPYLGQGACSGIRDAANLAWKLDLVLRGLAGRQVLDTYESERRPHADFVVQSSIALGRIANTTDPEAAAARDKAFLDGTAAGPAPFPRLLDGVLHSDDETAGTVAPQGRLTIDERSGRGDDVLGGGFRLIATSDGLAAITDDDRHVLTALDVKLLDLGSATDEDDRYTQLLEENRAGVALIRPDHIVYGVAAAAEASDLIQSLGVALHGPVAAS